MIKTFCTQLGQLALLQLARMLLKAGTFLWLPHTPITDTLINSLLMGMMALLLLGWIKRHPVPLFPSKFSMRYGLYTGGVLLFFGLTILLTWNGGSFFFYKLVYGSILIPLLEEPLFRGVIWQQWETGGNETQALLFSTFLFGLWHIGYADTILWRVGIFQPGVYVVEVLFWKVVTALLLGLLFGLARLKGKNVYPAFLLHCLINACGI